MKEAKVSDLLHSNYENYYEEGDSEWRRIGAEAKVENIVKLCEGLPRNSILEIGAGEGSILRKLSELRFGDNLFALEISKSGVEAIRKKNIPNVKDCKVFDGYNIPYDNERFDIAILSHVIEHVEYPRQLFYEASRVAKYVFVEVPLEDTIRLPRDFFFDKVGHINFYNPKTIRRLAQSCNLRVLKQYIANPPKGSYLFLNGKSGLISYFIKHALITAMPRLATSLFTYHCALVCEKNNGELSIKQ